MNYTGLGPPQPLAPDSLHRVWGVVRRGLILASTVLLALLISGGIFTFTPLVGLRIAHTSGVSMEPAYRNGDVVLIKDAGEEDLHVGDIVVFNALGEQFMHRIIEQRTGPDGEMIVVTQGDNVPSADFPIPASQVSGKLIGEVPVLGSISRLLDAQGGFYVYRSIILTLAVTAVAIWGLVVSARGRRQTMTVEETPPVEDAEAPREPEA